MRTISWCLIILITCFQSCKNKNESQHLLQSSTISSKKTDFQIDKKNGALTILVKNKPLLTYQYKTVYPPKGVDSAYKRSGYIHPLKTLSGHTLTRIQPEDHYHHYGIWNPWTHVLFEGDTLDFWNLRKKQATVRFAGFKSSSTHENIAQYQALHEHIVLKNSEDKIALNELQTVTVQQPGEDYYTIDFILNYTCATNSPFKILKYRYAGFGWRTTETWNNNNSEILSSEGKTRENIDSTTARWCIVQGALGESYGGSILMSHPKNYNHPEPLRIWPATAKNHGDIFVNISPTKTTDWLLESGKTYTLKYRLVVFNGKYTSEKAETLWQNYIK